MSSQREDERFYFIGERACIDFVNTEVVQGGQRIDLLHGYDDLVAWYAAAGVLTPSESKVLQKQRNDAEADRTFRQAIRFRATLREMLESIAEGRRSVAEGALRAINEVLALATGGREVVRTKHGYETRTRRRFTTPNQLLVTVAESAADLLSSDDLGLVKKCQNPQCILFFYDTTRNHGRRWCSMAACGNRAKVAAHYRRAREHAPDVRS